MFSFKENGQNYTQRGHWVSHAVSTGSGSQERLSCPGFPGSQAGLSVLSAELCCARARTSLSPWLPARSPVEAGTSVWFRLFGIQAIWDSGNESCRSHLSLCESLNSPPRPAASPSLHLGLTSARTILPLQGADPSSR